LKGDFDRLNYIIEKSIEIVENRQWLFMEKILY
jgi:hypothetical protein